MTAKLYGTYRHVPLGESQLGRPYWIVNAEPHTTIKLKRHFPRVAQERPGGFVIADTLEVGRDLEWFIDRFPLAAYDLHSELHLVEQAAQHRTVEEQVVTVLDGNVEPRPDWLIPAVEPRKYQLIAAEMVRLTGRLLLGDDVGLGKTFSGALVLRDPAAVPALVVTETHLVRQWNRELNWYFPQLTTHIARTGTAYNPTQLTVGRGRNRRPMYDRQPDVLILTYSKLAGWAEYLHGNLGSVFFDEMQALRHNDTARYIAAVRVSDGTRYRAGLTATPIYNYGDEIHTLIDVLDPTVLGTRDEFKREWCTDGDASGNQARVKVKDPAALGTYLRDAGIFLRRTRADVGRELPPIVPVEQNVDVDPAELAKVADDVAAMARLVLDKAGDHKERFRAAGEMEWKMRRATGLAKAPYVAAFVRLLLETEDKVVLWAWHRDVWDVLLAKLADFNPVMYTGSESPAAKDAAEEAFKHGDARVLLMSLRSGAGLDGLQEVCRVGVFGELDWSPQVHTQAIGRLHRDGQDEPVLAYYLVSDEGSDPPIAEVLDVKRQQSDPILNPDGALFVATGSEVNRTALLAREVLRRQGGVPERTAA